MHVRLIYASLLNQIDLNDHLGINRSTLERDPEHFSAAALLPIDRFLLLRPRQCHER